MSELIDLAESKGYVYVWNAEDWLKLRSKHRIVGELVGCLPKLPRQEILQGLPLLLTDNEASLLLEKKIARIVRYESIVSEPSEAFKKAFEEYREKLFVEQEVCLKEERAKKLTSVMDKIVEGKKRKLLGIATSKKKLRKGFSEESTLAMQKVDIDREKLLKDEMAKLPKLERSEALVQTHTAYPWSTDGDIQISTWDGLATPEKMFKYRIYKDLWERGYYITGGQNFGGDFLVYPGDPIMFHSQFIIICRRRSENIPVTELIAQCRVGCHVRKTLVIASLSANGEDVTYQSFQWADACLP